MLEKLYCRHSKKTITLLKVIKDITDIYNKYEMGASLNSLRQELPNEFKNINLEKEMECLLNANYIKISNKEIYILSDDGMNILRKYSTFNTLNGWHKFVAIISENTTILSLVALIISILSWVHSNKIIILHK